MDKIIEEETMCQEGEWVKVANNKTSRVFWCLSASPNEYRIDYVKHGHPPPENDNTATIAFGGGSYLLFADTHECDVYIKAIGFNGLVGAGDKYPLHY